jgi:N-acyl-D-aspartate/D-glutamate deacylase
LSRRTSRRTIALHDEVVSPGFIDMMGASSLPLLDDPPSAESKLRQGITTLLAGEGVSAAPQNDQTLGWASPGASYVGVLSPSISGYSSRKAWQ